MSEGILTPPTPQSKSRSLVSKIIIGVILVGGLLVGGWFAIDAIRQSNVAETIRLQEEQSRKEKREEDARTARNLASRALRDLISTSFPEWTLAGDTFDPNTTEFETQIVVKVHLKRGERERVVTVHLQQFKSGDGDFENRQSHWAAYLPTGIELGTVELEGVKKKEFQTGQENPPDYGE